MKKIGIHGLLAISLATLIAPHAFAWKNGQWGLGLSWCYQSGGNNLLWGAFRNGQPPAPECNNFGNGPCPGSFTAPPPHPGYGSIYGPLAPSRSPQGNYAATPTSYDPYRLANYYYPYPGNYGR